MSPGVGSPTTTGRWIHYGPMGRWAWVPGGFNRWRPALVDFYWGGNYFGWAPRGYYGRGIGGANPTTVAQNNTLRNWNPRDRSNGLTVVNRNDLGREPTRTRVLASGAIVGGLRQGLPRELRRSRVWNRNSAFSRSDVRSSRLASRPTGISREGVLQGGSRRSSVARSGTDGTRTRAQQSFRSRSSSRSLSRSSPASRGSFATRSSRNASRPSVWSSRRSRPSSSPTFTSPSVRSSSRSVSRTPYPSMQRTTPTYRSPAPSVSRSPSPRVQSPPRHSGSSGGGSRSRSTSRSRN